jgi:DNA-binding HxlR family transcriptional regulator
MGDALVPQVCLKFHRASELIGRRWTGAIIYCLLRSRCRFATFRLAIPDITDRMLSERLQELEQEGIVSRIVVPDIPVRVEYELTKKGRALASVMDEIGAWAEKWVIVEAASEPSPRASAARSAGRGRTRSARPARRSPGRSTA